MQTRFRPDWAFTGTANSRDVHHRECWFFKRVEVMIVGVEKLLYLWVKIGSDARGKVLQDHTIFGRQQSERLLLAAELIEKRFDSRVKG
ncbi:MAG: hypothetical protein N2C12_17840 [Planctomycetales bacterium]